MKKEKKNKTCELCGFSFDERFMHECDTDVLANRVEQEERSKRGGSEQLEVGEMYLTAN
jgi:hypothetical protein